MDVGYGQVVGSIAQDPRVTVMERTNLRHLQPQDLPCKVSQGSGVAGPEVAGRTSETVWFICVAEAE